MSHTGRPRVEQVGDSVLVLCPVGHLVESIPVAEWAWSREEAKYGDPRTTVTCDGAMPDEEGE